MCAQHAGLRMCEQAGDHGPQEHSPPGAMSKHALTLHSPQWIHSPTIGAILSLSQTVLAAAPYFELRPVDSAAHDPAWDSF